MMLSDEIMILPPKYIITEESASLLGCVEMFECGAENIYLVDIAGCYRWRAAQKASPCIACAPSGHWILAMKPLSPIVFEKEISDETMPELLDLCAATFARNAGVRELPIVDSGGGNRL